MGLFCFVYDLVVVNREKGETKNNEKNAFNNNTNVATPL
jgi:hypothetical protein